MRSKLFNYFEYNEVVVFNNLDQTLIVFTAVRFIKDLNDIKVGDFFDEAIFNITDATLTLRQYVDGDEDTVNMYEFDLSLNIIKPKE